MAITSSPRVFLSKTLQSKTPKAQTHFRFDFEEVNDEAPRKQKQKENEKQKEKETQLTRTSSRVL